MRIEVHDVDHGGCTVITGPTGHRLMLDCGLSRDRPWYPSITYRDQRIDTLMLMNLDEDHCEDLPHLWRNCSIGGIVSNPTVDAQALRSMKAECGMRAGVEAATTILERFGPGFLGDWSHDLGGVAWHVFWNRYRADFTDTNNLSLATFVHFGPFTILFGGDLERAGWRRLLRNPNFRAKLATTTVYVASHHGRENGCCDEVFEICSPELVIFSDGSKQYGTQETRDWYAKRARGIPDVSKPAGLLRQPVRKVMTKRRDGTIMIEVGDDGRFWVSTRRQDSGSELSGQIARLLALGHDDTRSR
jgi:beta-lactamase superfamily II metal-dependent hydrolase